MADTLQGYATKLEALARSQGLDYYPVHFEEVPSSFMMEVAVYGLPVRMPHWSFGVRYIHQLIQHQMGHSRLFVLFTISGSYVNDAGALAQCHKVSGDYPVRRL